MNVHDTIRRHRSSRPLFILAAPLAAVVVAPVLGCADTECADGTYRDAHRCVASVPVACGAGTELRAGECISVAGGAQCGAGTHAEGGACVPDLAATANGARFFDVSIDAPTQLAALANFFVSESFRAGNGLLFVAKLEAVPERIRIFGGGGVRNDDGSYALDAADAYDASATRAGDLIATDPFGLRFPAFGEDPLVLEAAVLSGLAVAVTDGVELVVAGEFSGVITPANAEALYIDVANQTLLDVLDNIGETPDVDHDGDGKAESWRLAGTFTTEPIWLF
jgi:hypothetical protein